MDAELKKKNTELKLENKKLKVKISGIQDSYKNYTDLLESRICELEADYNNYVASMEARLAEQKELERSMTEHLELVKSRLEYYIDAHCDSEDKLKWLRTTANCQKSELKDKDNILEKFKKAPKENKKNTDTLWEPYRQKFSVYIAEGKTESWAKNAIGNLMEKEGVWKKASKKDPQKIITRPDRATLHRQLVTNRK